MSLRDLIGESPRPVSEPDAKGSTPDPEGEPTPSSADTATQEAALVPELAPSEADNFHHAVSQGGQVTSGQKIGAAESLVAQGAEDEPWGVAQEATPSGIEIYFQAGPNRLYRINGEEVVSVTTAQDFVSSYGKAAWWGQGVGVEGVLTLVRELGYSDEIMFNSNMRSEEVVALLTEHKLTTNHNRDKAGQRGTDIHTALEIWAETGMIPEVAAFPEEQQGYVIGLCNFINDSQAIPASYEVMVGSRKHKFAGRYDLDVMLASRELVTKTYPKRTDVRTVVPEGLWRIDLKTSKSIYETHFTQIAAYEEAAVECGYSASDYQGILHVTKDGRYELVPNNVYDKKAKRYDWKKRVATFKDYKAILTAYRALEGIKVRS